MGFKQAAFSASLLLTFALLLFSPLANASHNDYILTEIDESDNAFFKYVPGSKTIAKVGFKTTEFGADVVQGFGQGIWDTVTGLGQVAWSGTKMVGNAVVHPIETFNNAAQGVDNFLADPFENTINGIKATGEFGKNVVVGYGAYLSDCPAGHVGQCIGKGTFEVATIAVSAGKIGKIATVAKEAKTAAQLQKAAQMEKVAIEAAKLQKLRKIEAAAQKAVGQAEKAKLGQEGWMIKKTAEKLAEAEKAKAAKAAQEAKRLGVVKLAAEKSKGFTNKLTEAWTKFKNEFTRPLKVEPVGHFNPETFKPFAGPHIEVGPLSAFTKPLGNLLFGNTKTATGLSGAVTKTAQSVLFSHPVNPFTLGAAVKGLEQNKKTVTLTKPAPKLTTPQKTITTPPVTTTQKTTTSSSSSSSGLSTLGKTALKALTTVSPVANTISKAVNSITSFFTAPKPTPKPAPTIRSAPAAPTVRSAPAPTIRSAPAPAPSRSAPSAPSRSSSGGSRSSGGGRGRR